MHLWIVLPAYNEAANLPAIFDGFRQVVRDTYNLQVDVIVVDDASTDHTAQVARELGRDTPVTLLQNDSNKGLAETFMRGMRAAAERAADADIIVCMDADNTHLPGQVLRMMRNIQEGRDVVIASRYQPGAVVRGVPPFRRLLSRCMSPLFRAVFPIGDVRDYSCGYRAYRAALLKRTLAVQGDTLFSQSGFACMVGILLRLHKAGAVCGEVPIVLRYDQKEGFSKMRIGRTISQTLGLLLRERFSGRWNPSRDRAE
jgi:dolichol-phosphate mannosyltransferase